MRFVQILAISTVGLALGGCVAAPSGYWDYRLAQMPLAYNYGCRNALAVSNREEAVLYCPSDMPLPPNGVWRPGLSGAR